MNCLWILILLCCCRGNRNGGNGCGNSCGNSCIQPRTQRCDNDNNCGCTNDCIQSRNMDCDCDNTCGCESSCGCENDYRERVRAPFSPDDGDCGCGR